MSRSYVRTSIPFRLDLEQLYAEAGRLQVASDAGDEAALERIRRVYPDYRLGDLMPMLAFQTVIAAEHGLADWPELAAHVARMDEARRAIEREETEGSTSAQDEDLRTLHIRCGSDLEETLPAAGFKGDFLEFSDAVCQGPLRPGPSYVADRAEFLYNAYISFFPGMVAESQSEARDKLDRQHERLSEAAAYSRVVLWFEHDSYDQLILIQILAYLSRHGRPKVLEMVTLDHFPGSTRFIGLGQLPPEALRLLWPTRTVITAKQLALGERAWNALCSPAPTDLLALTEDPASDALPHLRNALTRHLREFPSVENGLGLTEQLVLELLQEGARSPGELFRDLMRDREPLPWLGDLMFLHILRNMSRAGTPVFTGWASPESAGWPQDQLALTDTGRAVLAGEIDWMELHPPVRWLGGVEIDPADDPWRWDSPFESLRRGTERMPRTC